MQHRSLMPLLLLDDALEALDPLRQQRLLERLSIHSGQVLMTGPSGTYISASSKINYFSLDTPIQKSQDEIQPVATGVEEGPDGIVRVF